MQLKREISRFIFQIGKNGKKYCYSQILSIGKPESTGRLQNWDLGQVTGHDILIKSTYKYTSLPYNNQL